MYVWGLRCGMSDCCSSRKGQQIENRLLLQDPAHNFGDGHPLCIESPTQIACLLRNSGVICGRADSLFFFFKPFQTVVHSTVLRGFSQVFIYALHAALVACCRFDVHVAKHPRAQLRLGRLEGTLAGRCVGSWATFAHSRHPTFSELLSKHLPIRGNSPKLG